MIVYHAWEPYQFPDWQSGMEVVASPYKPTHLIVGMKQSKDSAEFLRPMLPHATTLWAVAEPGQHLALPVERSAGLFFAPAPRCQFLVRARAYVRVGER